MKSNLKLVDNTNTCPIRQKSNDIINEAVKAGYTNPFDDDDMKNAMFIVSNGKKYFRPVVSFEMCKYEDLFQSQNRKKVVDERYCSEELIPRLKKEGRIHTPLLSEERTSNTRNIIQGHHRHYSSAQVFGEDALIPTFVLSSDVYPIQADKTLGAPQANLYIKHLGKVKSVNTPKTLSYDMKDIHGRLAELYKLDKTFGGLNPSGKFPERDGTFEDIMDDLFPDNWQHKGTRTKIYNAWSKGGDLTSKIKSPSFSDVTNDFVKYGFNPGVTIRPSGKQVRDKFPNYTDAQRRCFIAEKDTNAKGVDRDIFVPILEMTHNTDNSSLPPNVDSICLYHKIYNPPSDISGLIRTRETALKDLANKNELLSACGSPVFFRFVIFPKQLTTASDEGAFYEWDKGKQAFVQR